MILFIDIVIRFYVKIVSVLRTSSAVLFYMSGVVSKTPKSKNQNFQETIKTL